MALACLVGLADPIPARAQTEPAELNPNLVQQLKAVIEDTMSQTAAQQKIDSFLLTAIKQQRGEATPMPVWQGLDVANDGTVVVEITCPVTDDIATVIEGMGGTVLNSHPRKVREHFAVFDALKHGEKEQT